jgi:hypothetical protein
MGYIPETYRLFRAAKYIGVSPWELSEQSVFWMNHALEYENIENRASAKRQERASKAARRKRA